MTPVVKYFAKISNPSPIPKFEYFQGMKRKHFLQGIIPAAFSIQAIAASSAGPKKKFRIPPYLQAGDTIGITAPAGYIEMKTLEPALQRLDDWGFKVQLGKSVGTGQFSFSASDKIRKEDFQSMLDQPEIKAILCARGGYGAVRIIDDIDFSRFSKHPKWIIGFSDITVFHAHINSKLRIATLHSKMCNSFPSDWNLADDLRKATINSIYDCLTGKRMQYQAESSVMNKPGTAVGEIVGGNLRTIETLAGTASDYDTTDKILFVEDTGEYLYSIDRMFWNLKRSGKLSRLKGLIVGGFKEKKEEPDERFGKTLEEIVLEKTKAYDYPVCFNFPVGHQVNNFALKCGVVHRLEVQNSKTILTQL